MPSTAARTAKTRFRAKAKPTRTTRALVHRAPLHPWIAQIDRLQHGFQLNQIEFAAQLLHCAPRSLILWKNGRPPNPAIRVRLNELQRLYDALAQIMPPEDVAPWMKQTNDYLNPLTPLEVIARGHIDRLWHIIHAVATGMPT
jgi:hypothetical protein